jgi:hypothetical protein
VDTPSQQLEQGPPHGDGVLDREEPPAQVDKSPNAQLARLVQLVAKCCAIKATSWKMWWLMVCAVRYSLRQDMALESKSRLKSEWSTTW